MKRETSNISRIIRTAALLITIASIAVAQERAFRPPAIPLVACDPYFSIWSVTDHPADSWPKHWTGTTQAMCSMARIDGKPFRLLGSSPADAPKMTLKGSEITPTRTIYSFEDAGIMLVMTFTTPVLPYDLAVLSRPVSYVSWRFASTDGREHEVAIYFDATAELVVNTPDQKVTWSRLKKEGMDVLSVGSLEQPVLAKSGDDLRIDWGYLYLVCPASQQAGSVITDYASARMTFVRSGKLPPNDDLRMPRQADDAWPVLAYTFGAPRTGAQGSEFFLVLAYDDVYSIEYLNRRLPAYWKSTGMRIDELLERSVGEYGTLLSQCQKFDEEFVADLRKAGGEHYAKIASLAYREAFAAHKLAADVDGTPMLFPKENFSNGCIATVDVIYPAAPIFLLLNTELLKATLTPVMNYSMLKRWKFPFAPHDLGTYPLANGQVYGGGEQTEEDQMPIEESGNLLILLYAVAKAEGNAQYALRYWPALEKWANYLKEKGLDPENQLCTDDFAGHLAHNVNLSLKAIISLGCYSKLCGMVGKEQEAKQYWKIASGYVREWERMARDGDHFKLAFDRAGTWSQKYNLVWDKILDLNLFSKEIAKREIEYYKTKMNQFGLPLDNRKDYTKTDWLLWTATLADNQSDFASFVSKVYDFVNQTPNRVPLTDWYDTKTSAKVGFQARPVIGGVFIKMLTDPDIWAKWAGRSKR